MTAKRDSRNQDEDLNAADLVVEDLEGSGNNRPAAGSQPHRANPRGRPPPPSGAQAGRRATALSSAVVNIGGVAGAAAAPKKLLWQKGRLIGTGGFGKVFLGLDGNTGTLLAAKEFDLTNTSNRLAEQVAALQKEIKLMKCLQHRNIVKYIGADRKDKFFYIFMEYVPGGSLRSILDQFGPLQDAVASSFTKQIIRGLHFLHRNDVIHRDIKAANALVSIDGYVKLADFGSAQYTDDVHGTHGTPYWMAPEVIRQETVGKAADVWSVGCCVLEMLTGNAPFAEIGHPYKTMVFIAGDEPIKIPAKITNPYTRDFISVCLTRDPRKRPTTRELLKHDFLSLSCRSGSADSNASVSSCDQGIPSSTNRVQASASDLALPTQPTAASNSGSPPTTAELGGSAASDDSGIDSDEADAVTPLDYAVRQSLVNQAMGKTDSPHGVNPLAASSMMHSVSINGPAPLGSLLQIMDASSGSGNGNAPTEKEIVSAIGNGLAVDRDHALEFDVDDASSDRSSATKRSARSRISETEVEYEQISDVSALSADGRGGNKHMTKCEIIQRVALVTLGVLVLVLGALLLLTKLG